MASTLNAALNYAKRGWAVLPLHHVLETGRCSCARPECPSPGKHPRTGSGLTEATTDADQIGQWWQKWPESNVGIATGKASGIVAIDVDTKGGGMNNLAMLMDVKGSFSTLSTITGSGGYHWIFQAPDIALRSTTGVIAHGVDTRGEGGYIVAPPSNHVSGNCYEWDVNIDPILPPSWLQDLWPTYRQDRGADAAPETVRQEMPNWVSRALEYGSEEGERNNTAIRLAGYFHSRGIPADVTTRIMSAYADKCDPPMDARELAQVIQSAERYPILRREPDYHEEDLAPLAQEPEFRGAGGIYEMIWPQHHIMIRADRFYEDRHYVTHCEMTVSSTMPGMPAHIHQARVNLTSSSTRRSIIKELSERLAEVPWGHVVESFCVKILEAHRQGDPFIDMAEYSPGESLRHRVYPFLLENEPTVFYGQGESGKSYFAIYLAVLVASGYSPPEMGITVEPGKVLYLDYETKPTDVWERINQITAGMNLPIPDNFTYRRMVQSLPADIELIQRWVLSQGISLVVIDSGAPASIDPETSAGATAYFAALRSLNCTTLTIAHQEASGRQDRPFGSVYWRNLSRANFRFQSDIQPGENHFTIGVKHTKGNNTRRLQDTGFQFVFEDYQVTVRRAALHDVASLSKTLSVRERMQYALTNGSMIAEDIAEAIDAPLQQVRNQLVKGPFVKAGTNLGRTLWDNPAPLGAEEDVESF